MWSETASKGLTMPYPNISLHAAQAPGSRGENSPGCIYMQLDGTSCLLSESTTNGHTQETPDGEEGGDKDELVEMHLVPADESTCCLRSFHC